MSAIIEMLSIFRGKKYQIKTVAKRLCLNITLSMNNGDKFYSFDEDKDFRVPFPVCAIDFSPEVIINSVYFQNFIRQTGISIKKYRGKFMIDYPK
jgi:hypothetical protein